MAFFCIIGVLDGWAYPRTRAPDPKWKPFDMPHSKLHPGLSTLNLKPGRTGKHNSDMITTPPVLSLRQFRHMQHSFNSVKNHKLPLHDHPFSAKSAIVAIIRQGLRAPGAAGLLRIERIHKNKGSDSEYSFGYLFTVFHVTSHPYT